MKTRCTMTRSCVRWVVHLAWYQAMLVDAPCLVYASLVVPWILRSSDGDPRLFWPLWVAKYNGFAIQLCGTYLLVSVMKNLKKAVRDHAMSTARRFKVVEHRWAVGNLPMFWSHRAYTWRLLASGLAHTVVHAVLTHPLRIVYDEQYATPLSVDAMLNHPRLEHADLPWYQQALVLTQSVLADTYTWTGYALLLSFIGPVLWTGARLASYSRLHFFTLTAHRLLAAATVPLFVLHHPFYGWPALWLALFLADAALGLWTTHRCTPVYVYRYPNSQLEDEHQANDVVDVGFRMPYASIERFQPGDFVRVQVPEVSRWEWHDFTLMRTETCGPLECVLHVTVRSVGRWTSRLYTVLDNEATELLIKGPYGLQVCDPVVETILTAASDRFGHADESRAGCMARALRMPPPKRLVLVCTGTAITHFLSLLDTLIPLYYAGYRNTQLPQRIVVCWTVRTVFNLNFALIPLSRYQRQLADSSIDGLLSYEFFVTQRPNNSDALHAQRFRRLLMHAERCTGAVELRGAHHDSALIRNSRLSTLDPVANNATATSIGSRLDYDAFGDTYLRDAGGDDTLIIVNTSVATIQRRFRALARQHGCRIHVECLV